MRRILAALLFSISIIALYQFININLFAIDFNKRVSNSLMRSLRHDPTFDPEVVLFNSGKLTIEEIRSKIDTLITFHPKTIGINLCHLDQNNTVLFKDLIYSREVLICSCDPNSKGRSARMVDNPNTTCRFRSDSSNYFEIKLSDSLNRLTKRNNEWERVNYRDPFKSYFHFELEKIEAYSHDNIEGKIVLIGYLGDYVTGEILDYKNCRITPLNDYYGEDYISPDMYDTQISANIISTINEDIFINEINPIVRVGIILAFSILNVVLLTFIRTKWLMLNLFLDLLVFIFLIGFGSFLIVYLFSLGYYVELNELTLILIITTIFTVGYNVKERRVSVDKK